MFGGIRAVEQAARSSERAAAPAEPPPPAMPVWRGADGRAAFVDFAVPEGVRPAAGESALKC